VIGLKHEAHPSSASAVTQATYQSSIDFSYPQKGGTEVGNVSAREIVEVMTNTTFDLLREQCPRVTSIDVTFKKSHNSLSGDDIIDILKDDSDEFKKLLEECLLAKKIVLHLFDNVASEFEDYGLDKDDALAIYNDMFLRVFKCNPRMIYFPLLLKQKLLVTACKHWSNR